MEQLWLAAAVLTDALPQECCRVCLSFPGPGLKERLNVMSGPLVHMFLFVVSDTFFLKNGIWKGLWSRGCLSRCSLATMHKWSHQGILGLLRISSQGGLEEKNMNKTKPCQNNSFKNGSLFCCSKLPVYQLEHFHPLHVGPQRGFWFSPTQPDHQELLTAADVTRLDWFSQRPVSLLSCLTRHVLLKLQHIKHVLARLVPVCFSSTGGKLLHRVYSPPFPVYRNILPRSQSGISTAGNSCVGLLSQFLPLW
ncbi:hypothetical protein XENOCAPTIV_029917 [Xenoophorus captivus]|uniref:Uncharacterized protein n=1 Tax=Xenoophorus captivus TaxID=1517983 RepID=A0ABV0RVV3_9TELE